MATLGDVRPTIGVSDIEKATGFYGGVLGLKVVDESEDKQMVVYESGNSNVEIYVTDVAGTNQATYATWEVEDIETAIADLKDKDVTFEHYDFPNGTRDGDIHVLGDEKAAWFKDPDGNILCLHQLG